MNQDLSETLETFGDREARWDDPLFGRGKMEPTRRETQETQNNLSRTDSFRSVKYSLTGCRITRREKLLFISDLACKHLRASEYRHAIFFSAVDLLSVIERERENLEGDYFRGAPTRARALFVRKDRFHC